MDRLTKPNYKFDMLNIMQGLNRCTEIDEIMNRLAAYEDTGFDPDEIPRWIPVRVRLPEESEYREKATGELIPLLVCVKGTVYPFRAMYDGKSWGDGTEKIDVIYWMPLPTPPEGEK